MKTNLLAIFGLVLIASIMATQLVMAVDFNQDISSEDQATFDEILEPVMKIYNLVKYSATVLSPTDRCKKRANARLQFFLRDCQGQDQAPQHDSPYCEQP